MNYKSIKKVEDNSCSAEEHYTSLGKGLTDRFKTGVEYVKNSSAGKKFGSMRDEIALSAFTTKEALKKPETRKLWLVKHVPEFFTLGYLVAYGVADFRYYQNPILSKLAKDGLTTQGTYTQPLGSYSLNVVKPWIAPPENHIPTDYNGNVLSQLRSLSIWENDIVGGLLGTIPTAAKYIVKGVKHFRDKKE